MIIFDDLIANQSNNNRTGQTMASSASLASLASQSIKRMNIIGRPFFWKFLSLLRNYSAAGDDKITFYPILIALNLIVINL